MDFAYLAGMLLLWVAVWGLAQGCKKLQTVQVTS